MNKRIVLALGTIALCTGLLTGCGKVTKKVDINYGETYKIQNEKLEGKVNLTWKSENTDVAEVAEDGTVTAKAPGKVKVNIKEDGKEIGEYTFNVSIVPIEQIIFSADPLKVTSGNTVSVKYTLLPKDASDYGITWTISDDTIAKIVDNANIKLTGRVVGQTTLIATAQNGVTAQCAIEVTQKSAYERLSKAEKQFVDDVLSIIDSFKNPASVRFNSVYEMSTGSSTRPYLFEVSAQNGFGGTTVSTYLYDKPANMLMKWSVGMAGNELRANLITQAVHEKLGY